MRIGINVPNDLLQQVKQINPPVNVSDVCRKALQQQVDDAQRVAARIRDDGVGTKVSQLSRQTGLPPDPDWVGLALDNAVNWVRNVTPEDWDDFVEDVDGLRGEEKWEALQVGVWSSMYDGKGMMSHLTEHQNRVMSAARPSVSAGPAREAWDRGLREYARAWLGYVYEVRRLIEQRHKEAYERLRVQYDAAFRARGEPEVPEHLL